MATSLNEVTRNAIVKSIIRRTETFPKIEPLIQEIYALAYAIMYDALKGIARDVIHGAFKNSEDFRKNFVKLFDIGTYYFDDGSRVKVLDVTHLHRVSLTMPCPRMGQTEPAAVLKNLEAAGDRGKELIDLIEQVQKISSELERLKNRVMTVVCTYRSVEGLLKAYPEWEPVLKPLIVPKGGSSTALADPSLATDLMKLGFPDGGKPKASKPVVDLPTAAQVVTQAAA